MASGVAGQSGVSTGVITKRFITHSSYVCSWARACEQMRQIGELELEMKIDIEVKVLLQIEVAPDTDVNRDVATHISLAPCSNVKKMLNDTDLEGVRRILMF